MTIAIAALRRIGTELLPIATHLEHKIRKTRIAQTRFRGEKQHMKDGCKRNETAWVKMRYESWLYLPGHVGAQFPALLRAGLGGLLGAGGCGAPLFSLGGLRRLALRLRLLLLALLGGVLSRALG